MQFQDLVNQQNARASFAQSVRSNRLSHALALKGPPGAGKLPFALAAAQFANCLQPLESDSCGECASCRKFAQLAHPDLYLVFPYFSKTVAGRASNSEDFMDAFRARFTERPYMSAGAWAGALEAENKQLMIPIHEIRALKSKVYYKAYEAKYKIIIVWQADKMRQEAANAFLKLLEEPPDETLIFLTTDDPTQLLPTIRSRCQFLTLGRLPSEDIRQYLTAKHGLASAAAEETALMADGSLARALEILQHSDESFSKEFIEWMRMCYEGLMVKFMEWTDRFARNNKEYHKLFLAFALQKTRDALLYRYGAEQLALNSGAEREFLRKFSQFLDAGKIERMQSALEDAGFHIARNANANLTFLNLSLNLHEIMRGAGR